MVVDDDEYNKTLSREDSLQVAHAILAGNEPPEYRRKPAEGKREQLVRDIAQVINRLSLENASNTPDFILAEYLVGCLEAYDSALKARLVWWGSPPETKHEQNELVSP